MLPLEVSCVPIVDMSRSFSRLNSPGSPSSTGKTRSGRSVAVTCSSSLSPTSSRSRPRARFSRERTVPTGTSSAVAIWSYGMPSQAKSSRASRSPCGSVAIAAATSAQSREASRRASTSEKRSDAVIDVFTSRAVASRRRASPCRWRARRLLAIPYSQGRASARSVSKPARFSKAMRKSSPEQRVGVIGADPAHEVPEHRRGVPVEQLAEGGRRRERARDDLGIGARIHHLMFLARRDEFGISAESWFRSVTGGR